MNLLRELFAHVCGQQHCWVLGGQALPFCQRCTGLYVGGFCALILILAFRLRPNAFLYWVHGIFLLVMIPFGFHFVSQGAFVRTSTGVLFGFGLVYYLALNPFTAWQWWKRGSLARSAAYLLLAMSVVPLLFGAVRSGGSFSAKIVAALGTLGLTGLSVLVVANLAVLPRTIKALHRQSSVRLA
jgi:uncharacterized membrane protein